MGRTITFLAVVLLVAGAAQAAPILCDLGNVSFSNPNGTLDSDPNNSNPQSDGNHWQGVRNQTVAESLWEEIVTDAIDATGATTPVDIWLNYFGQRAFDVVNRNGGNYNPLYDHPNIVPIIADQDVLNTNGDEVATVKFASLPGSSYDIVVHIYNTHSGWGEICAGYISVGATSYAFNGQTDGAVSLVFSGVAPTSGEISVVFEPDVLDSGQTYPFLNIDAIELIPEPATLSLLALGGLVAIRRRR